MKTDMEVGEGAANLQQGFNGAGVTGQSACEGSLGNVNDASWHISDETPYMAQLSMIGYPEHFDFLKEHYLGFVGQSSSETQVYADSSTNKIHDVFVSLALNQACSLVEKLDIEEARALFAGFVKYSIQPAESYDTGLQNRNIYLIKGASASECDAIGVLNVEWRLKVDSYMDKKKMKYQFALNVTVRTALYSDIDELQLEWNYFKDNFRN